MFNLATKVEKMLYLCIVKKARDEKRADITTEEETKGTGLTF